MTRNVFQFACLSPSAMLKIVAFLYHFSGYYNFFCCCWLAAWGLSYKGETRQLNLFNVITATAEWLHHVSQAVRWKVLNSNTHPTQLPTT